MKGQTGCIEINSEIIACLSLYFLYYLYKRKHFKEDSNPCPKNFTIAFKGTRGQHLDYLRAGFLTVL